MGRRTWVRTHLVRQLTALALVAVSIFVASPPTKAWKTFSGANTRPNATYWGGTGLDYAYSTAVDASGNQYVVGSFLGVTDFDPGAGTTTLTSVANEDIFISKFNSSGDFVWVKTIGGTGTDIARSLVIDASGQIYVAGYFTGGSPDFDPGAGTTTLTTIDIDGFILKLDSNGNFQWVDQITGPPASTGVLSQDFVYSLAISASGLYASGEFTDTTDFDPGSGTSNLVSSGGTDVFVAKYDLNGGYQWAKSFGGSSNDSARSIAVDSSGVYTAGIFRGTVDFDPGAGQANLKIGRAHV